MRRFALPVVLLAWLLASCGNKNSSSGAAPPYPGVPVGGLVQGEKNFAVLVNTVPRAQVVSVAPWAGYWWPYSQDGTAFADSKYEAATGNGGATSWEISNHGTGLPGIQSWWGHCNGWAAAAVLSREPTAARSVGGVSFSVGDQKALLSEIGTEVVADYFGQRDDSDDPSSLTFQDIFPNQFFLVMTNYVGRGFPAVMDRFAGSQVWNQPIAGYILSPITPSDSVGASPDAPNVYRVNATMQVWWLRDDVDPEHVTEPFQFQDGPSYDSRVYRFEVWLDAPPVFDGSGRMVSAGNVILDREGNTVFGGTWSNTDLSLMDSHPDYMWIPHDFAAPTKFANPYVDRNVVLQNFGS